MKRTYGWIDGLTAARQPNSRDDDDEGVDAERPKPPRIRLPHHDHRERDRAEDRDQERESDRQDEREPIERAD